MVAPDGFPVDALAARHDEDAHSSVGGFPAATAHTTPRRRGGARSVLHGVPCTPAFRAAVLALAERRGVTPSDLAASALLLMDPARMADLADSGAPEEGEEPAALELRLPASHTDTVIRRALAAVLALADPAGWRLSPAAEVQRLSQTVEKLEYRNKALVNALERVSFVPVEGGVRQVRDAAQLFGFVNEWCFDEDRVIRRFRELAPVYHPDTGVVGCRERMGQLIEARNMLIRHVRTAYASGEWVRRRSGGR